MARKVFKTHVVFMRTTAGLLIYCGTKIILVKQKGTKLYSIPKGEVKSDEDHLTAAIRETKEECGIDVARQNIHKKEYLCSIETPFCQRKLFYYKAFLSEEEYYKRDSHISDEIANVVLCNIEEAISIIQISQLGILWDEERNINRRILNKIVDIGWVNVEQHTTGQYLIYNYTDKCKREKAWNILTLWCRGLITDCNGKIIAYPLKKFFEYNQLFPECRKFSNRFEVSEKLDGFMGITFFIDGLPHIATRNSFISKPAIKGTIILYDKYLKDIPNMNANYTYIFEIVYLNDYLTLRYKGIEDLFLIDIIDNTNGNSVLKEVSSSLSFKTIKHEPNTHYLNYYLKQNHPGKEGLVLKFPNGDRLKIKYPWFKKKYSEKHEK